MRNCSLLDPVPELSFALHSAANRLLYPYSYDYVPAANWEEQVFYKDYLVKGNKI